VSLHIAERFGFLSKSLQQTDETDVFDDVSKIAGVEGMSVVHSY